LAGESAKVAGADVALGVGDLHGLRMDGIAAEGEWGSSGIGGDICHWDLI